MNKGYSPVRIITPTLTLPRQGGGKFRIKLLFPLPWREGIKGRRND
jgi:hypothetical protein